MEHQNSESRENVMAFIVMYERNDGSLAAESCQDLDAAVMAAERLRNSESIEHPRIYETTEVEYEFQTYFRVQIAGAAVGVDSTDGADLAEAATGAEASESTEEADIEWPSFDSSAADAEDETAEDAVSEAEAGAYGIGVGEIDGPAIEGDELEAAADDASTDVSDSSDDADAAEDDSSDSEDDESEASDTSEIDSSIDDDTYVSDSDILNVDEDAEVETDSEQKVGLFDKFVKTLEGESDVPADQVDDLSGTDTSRRGLFGR